MKMLKKEFGINTTTGLHARPASLLVDTADKYKAKVNIDFNDKTANAKSIISVLSLGLGKGDKFTLVVEGPDETEVMEELTEFIEQNLYKKDEEKSG